MEVIFLSSSVAMYIIISGKDCKHWLWPYGYCNVIHQLSKLDIMDIRELSMLYFSKMWDVWSLYLTFAIMRIAFLVKQVAWFVSCMLSSKVDYHNTIKDGWVYDILFSNARKSNTAFIMKFPLAIFDLHNGICSTPTLRYN